MNRSIYSNPYQNYSSLEDFRSIKTFKRTPVKEKITLESLFESKDGSDSSGYKNTEAYKDHVKKITRSIEDDIQTINQMYFNSLGFSNQTQVKVEDQKRLSTIGDENFKLKPRITDLTKKQYATIDQFSKV